VESLRLRIIEGGHFGEGVDRLLVANLERASIRAIK
jgi:hypothetical protein